MMFFDSIQWIRGWSYLDAGADIAYRKVIGAYKKKSLISFQIFGFKIDIGPEERIDSDAFIPAWSQKSTQHEFNNYSLPIFPFLL